MKNTIDSTQRTFLVQSQGFGNTKDIFCNLRDIPKIIRNEFAPNEEYKVFEYWNRTLKRVSKKHLKELYTANQIDPSLNIDSIDITALEWFDRVNDSSYFAATITVNFGRANEQTIKIPFQYGYGDHYKDMCFKELESLNIVKGVRHYNNGGSEGIWQYCERNRIELRTTKHENCKKSELKNI